MSERAISVAGTRDAGQWTVTICVSNVGRGDTQRKHIGKASTLAYAIASATLQALSGGINIDA